VTPVARSMKLLRAEGFIVATVERWLPRIERRSDCFGFGDLLACRPRDKAIVLVQVTTLPCLGARIKKAKGLPALGVWMRSGGQAVFHGWTRRAGKWRLKIVEINAGDLTAVVTSAPPRRLPCRHLQGELF
jgi:hypothetical protein